MPKNILWINYPLENIVKTPSKTTTKNTARKNSETKLKTGKATKVVAKKVTASPTMRKARMISVEQRFVMIEEAAYFIAEKNGFNPERTVQYWLMAEKEIDDKILT